MEGTSSSRSSRSVRVRRRRGLLLGVLLPSASQSLVLQQHAQQRHFRSLRPRLRARNDEGLDDSVHSVWSKIAASAAVSASLAAAVVGVVHVEPAIAVHGREAVSEYDRSSLEDRIGRLRAPFPDMVGAYSRLCETALEEGGANDDNPLFVEESEDEEASSAFASGLWIQRALGFGPEGGREASSVDDVSSSWEEAGFDTSLRLPQEVAPMWVLNQEPLEAVAGSGETGSGGGELGASEVPGPEDGQKATAKARHHVYPGSQQLEYSRKVHLQDKWNEEMKQLRGDNSPPTAPLGTFEYEQQLPWRYVPDFMSMRTLLRQLAVVGIVSFIYWSIQIFQMRRDSVGQLPEEYNIDEIEFYWSLRPEKVVRRSFVVLLEITSLLAGIVQERVARVAVALLGLSAVDFLDDTRKANASRLRESITRLGPGFIKMGQALASRPDLVGEDEMAELSVLQDALPYFPTKDAMLRIRKELHAPASRIFDWISEEPVAAASLGQVYKARIGDMTVAVKVQRPGLKDALALDCYILRSLSMLAMDMCHFFGITFRSDLVGAVDEFAARLFEEINYETECKNMRKFASLYGDIEGIYIPKVFEDYSSRRVITTEWIDGTKVIDENAQVSLEDLPLLQVGIQCTLMQLLDKGFLHADPHGGNLLKTRSGKLAYLDFGLVSEIPPSVMDTIICATVHLMNRDFESLASDFPGLALMSTGDLENDLPAFAAALEVTFDPIMTNFRAEVDPVTGRPTFPPIPFARLIDQMFSIAQQFSFSVPPYFLSNVRALGELEGLAMTADPTFNLLGAVYPYVAHRLLTDPSSRLRRALYDFVVDEQGMPRWELIDTLLQDANLSTVAQGGTATDVASTSFEFILSKEGGFLRQMMAQQMVNDIDLFVNRRIDNVEALFPRRFGLPTYSSRRATRLASSSNYDPSAIESRRRLRRMLVQPKLLKQPIIGARLFGLTLRLLTSVTLRAGFRVTGRFLADTVVLLRSILPGGGLKPKSRTAPRKPIPLSDEGSSSGTLSSNDINLGETMSNSEGRPMSRPRRAPAMSPV